MALKSEGGNGGSLGAIGKCLLSVMPNWQLGEGSTFQHGSSSSNQITFTKQRSYSSTATHKVEEWLSFTSGQSETEGGGLVSSGKTINKDYYAATGSFNAVVLGETMTQKQKDPKQENLSQLNASDNLTWTKRIEHGSENIVNGRHPKGSKVDVSKDQTNTDHWVATRTFNAVVSGKTKHKAHKQGNSSQGSEKIVKGRQPKESKVDVSKDQTNTGHCTATRSSTAVVLGETGKTTQQHKAPKQGSSSQGYEKIVKGRQPKKESKVDVTKDQTNTDHHAATRSSTAVVLGETSKPTQQQKDTKQENPSQGSERLVGQRKAEQRARLKKLPTANWSLSGREPVVLQFEKPVQMSLSSANMKIMLDEVINRLEIGATTRSTQHYDFVVKGNPKHEEIKKYLNENINPKLCYCSSLNNSVDADLSSIRCYMRIRGGMIHALVTRKEYESPPKCLLYIQRIKTAAKK